MSLVAIVAIILPRYYQYITGIVWVNLLIRKGINANYTYNL